MVSNGSSRFFLLNERGAHSLVQVYVMVRHLKYYVILSFLPYIASSSSTLTDRLTTMFVKTYCTSKKQL